MANKMEKIPASRNKWVKNQLTWFRDNIDNMDALRERALNLKNNVIDKRNLVCSFPKTTSAAPVCLGSLEILQAQGRDEALKPLSVPGNGSCWAISFLIGIIGRHNREMVHELRLSCLVYLLNKMSAVEIIAESRGVVCDIKSDILDLTCHTATKKKVKGNKSIHDPEGYGSWISLFCLAMQFDVKIVCIYPRVGPSNPMEIILTGILNGKSKRNGQVTVSNIKHILQLYILLLIYLNCS